MKMKHTKALAAMFMAFALSTSGYAGSGYAGSKSGKTVKMCTDASFHSTS